MSTSVAAAARVLVSRSKSPPGPTDPERRMPASRALFLVGAPLSRDMDRPPHGASRRSNADFPVAREAKRFGARTEASRFPAAHGPVQGVMPPSGDGRAEVSLGGSFKARPEPPVFVPPPVAAPRTGRATRETSESLENIVRVKKTRPHPVVCFADAARFRIRNEPSNGNILAFTRGGEKRRSRMGEPGHGRGTTRGCQSDRRVTSAVQAFRADDSSPDALRALAISPSLKDVVFVDRKTVPRTPRSFRLEILVPAHSPRGVPSREPA